MHRRHWDTQIEIGAIEQADDTEDDLEPDDTLDGPEFEDDDPDVRKKHDGEYEPSREQGPIGPGGI